jgi:hypothetical protein
MIYSHYYGAFVLACLLVFAVVFRSRYPVARLWWIGGALLMLALYMPWLTSGIVENVLESPKTAPPVLKSTLSVHWFSFASALNHFNNGKLFGVHERSPWWVYLTGGLLFTLPALIALRPLVTNRRRSPFDRRDKEATLLVALLWLLPLVAILGFGLLNIQYTVRYVVFCSAPYYVLIARGITGLGSPAMRRVWVVLILAYSVVSMRANYFVPYKENYRSAVNYLASHYSEEDCCIFFPVRTDRLPRYWTIYHRDHPGLRVANYDNIQRARTKCARVWLVVNKTWWWRWDREEYYEAQRKLDLTHSKVEEGRWSGMDFALYIPKPR